MTRPICEVMLDQRFFNGIGNYLRAEILHRAGIHPFAPARDIITQYTQQSAATTPAPTSTKTAKKGKSKSVKAEAAQAEDVLSLCRTVMLESLDILRKDGFASDSERGSFTDWLQCYMKVIFR